MINYTNKIRGYLKFSDDRVTIEQLEEFAKELANDPKFLSVYIRKVSRDQHGIGFIVDIDANDQETSDSFNEELKDKAYKKFGTGLVGWDISNRFILIK